MSFMIFLLLISVDYALNPEYFDQGSNLLPLHTVKNKLGRTSLIILLQERVSLETIYWKEELQP